jgi:hypothetical protein
VQPQVKPRCIDCIVPQDVRSSNGPSAGEGHFASVWIMAHMFVLGPGAWLSHTRMQRRGTAAPPDAPPKWHCPASGGGPRGASHYCV